MTVPSLIVVLVAGVGVGDGDAAAEAVPDGAGVVPALLLGDGLGEGLADGLGDGVAVASARHASACSLSWATNRSASGRPSVAMSARTCSCWYVGRSRSAIVLVAVEASRCGPARRPG